MDVPSSAAAALRRILDDFNRSWEEGDADRWTQHFAQEGDFMQAFGRYCADRTSTREFIGGFLALQRQGLRVREIETRSFSLGPGLVFGEQTIEASGVRNTDGSRQPPRRGHMMLIVRQDQEGWRIIHYRFCDLHTGPLRVEGDSDGPAPSAAVFRGVHRQSADQLAITPDGRWLVSTDPDRRLAVWDLRDLFGRQPALSLPFPSSASAEAAGWRATAQPDGGIAIAPAPKD